MQVRQSPVAFIAAKNGGLYPYTSSVTFAVNFRFSSQQHFQCQMFETVIHYQAALHALVASSASPSPILSNSSSTAASSFALNTLAAIASGSPTATTTASSTASTPQAQVQALMQAQQLRVRSEKAKAKAQAQVALKPRFNGKILLGPNHQVK